MDRNFVNLNINPCKQCMPLGAATAFKGIEGSIMLLHGSQGCSTYIRRHMAAHYNEPVDIASSSMTEKGTVYGGSENMKKALKNIIKQYNPQMIGVATTCLAETIGEDIKRIKDEFVEENQNFLEMVNLENIVSVQTPGYGGTQYEGYYRTVRALINTLAEKNQKEELFNIICPNISPSEVREIKRIFDLFQMSYVIIPDVSDTLDGAYKENFTKIPEGGTKLSDIKKMGNSKLTIEIGNCIEKDYSSGELLKEKFEIPYINLPLPIGYKNTKEFLKVLQELSGKEIPQELKKAEGRYIDAIIDAHKHASEGRAVIYGEPELVYSYTKFCIENGIIPVISATGSKNPVIKELYEDIKNKFNEETFIFHDTDFQTIQEKAVEVGANILIGNSDGKFVSEKTGIPQVRMGFPIHDRIGGQRIMHLFYEGGMRLLDEIVNTLLEKKYTDYREKMFNKYYKGVE